MTGFQDGDAITVPDPDHEGQRIRATLHEVAVGEPIDGHDTAWISYREGRLEHTTARVKYHLIRRAED
jgi:hypothetical protein